MSLLLKLPYKTFTIKRKYILRLNNLRMEGFVFIYIITCHRTHLYIYIVYIFYPNLYNRFFIILYYNIYVSFFDWRLNYLMSILKITWSFKILKITNDSFFISVFKHDNNNNKKKKGRKIRRILLKNSDKVN